MKSRAFGRGRIPALAAAPAIVCVCAEHPVAPVPFEGTYVLRSYEGKPLPALVFSSPITGNIKVVESGTLTVLGGDSVFVSQ